MNQQSWRFIEDIAAEEGLEVISHRHSASHVGDCPTSDFDAARELLKDLVPKRDGEHLGRPLWHDWAVVEAFLAGAKYGRQAA